MNVEPQTYMHQEKPTCTIILQIHAAHISVCSNLTIKDEVRWVLKYVWYNQENLWEPYFARCVILYAFTKTLELMFTLV